MAQRRDGGRWRRDRARGIPRVVASPRRRLSAVAAPVLALLVAAASGCSTAAPPWTAWAIPGRGQVVTLTSSASGLLVGRYDPTASVRTSLQLADASGTVHSVPVGAESRYAREARLVSVSTRGSSVVAFGGAPGGAHGNTRWTVWSGTQSGLAEQPQEFETFGGWRAGALATSAISANGPVILGSWSRTSQGGLDVGVWEAEGATWVQPQDPGAALDSTPTTMPAVRDVAALPAGYLAVGQVTVLSGGIRDEPAAWYAMAPSGPWQRVPMPRPRSGSDPVEAVAVSCTATRCLVVGRAGTDVVEWPVSAPRGALPQPAAPVTIASSSLTDQTPVMDTVAGADGGWVAWADADRTSVVHVAGALEAAGDPVRLEGRLVAVATDPAGRVVVATTKGLWRRSR